MINNGVRRSGRYLWPDKHFALEELKSFDPKLEYGGKEQGTFQPMKNTQIERGRIAALIYNMVVLGASRLELVRAVKHSMVVINAEEYGLDYKQSEADTGIEALYERYRVEKSYE